MNVFAVVLLVFPSLFVVAGPLRSAGSPSVLLGLLALLLYAVGKVLPGAGLDHRRQPVRLLLGWYLAAVLVAYAIGQARGLNASEGPGADRALVLFLSLIGIALLTVDGLPTMAAVRRFVLLLLLAAYFCALVAVLQFQFRYDLAAKVQLPGFVVNGDLFDKERSLFRRANGTSLHAIELGVLMSALLPLALHHARFGARRAMNLHRVGAALLLCAAAMSISRSGVIGLAVAFLVYISSMSWRQKFNALGTAVIAVACMRLLIPGLVGTLRSLFLNLENDPSVEGRTKDYALVSAFVSEDPWFGRGLGTFRPDVYFTLDNQVLLTLLEGGVLLLVASMLLYLTPIAMARRAARVTRDPIAADLCQALVAGLAVLLISAAFFDEFGFRQAVSLLFLFVGLSGALWRIMERDGPRTVPDTRGNHA